MTKHETRIRQPTRFTSWIRGQAEHCNKAFFHLRIPHVGDVLCPPWNGELLAGGADHTESSASIGEGMAVGHGNAVMNRIRQNGIGLGSVNRLMLAS